jgi:small subunit ribosomal protein S4
MARYNGPRQRIARRYKQALFGPSKALDKKSYGPGQHGKNKRSKLSNYGVQLMEKQKAKYIYGLLERQFRTTFQRAAKMKGSTGENLIRLLESRLDNFVYRMGVVSSRRAARQLVGHKHITVNGEIVNIPSYQVRPGDVVGLREGSKSLEILSQPGGRSTRFSWLEIDKPNLSAKLLHLPERADVPEEINERLIVELYSR